MNRRPIMTQSQPAAHIDSIEEAPGLLAGPASLHDITETVARPLEWKPPAGWYVVFAFSCTLLALFLGSVAWLFWEGVGIWGNNVPVAWGWPIVNFVFWVGIGHAGTLISAILFLFRQRWRTSISRAAEAMTIFAILCARIFPAIHTGRPWLAYWMLPVPNQMQLWPQFRSPLMWDVFAVSIYLTVSLLFWYVGLIPDFATLRDRTRNRLRQLLYGILALGWRGSHRQWIPYERAYLLLAGLATPLVLSVHSVVSFDFAVSQLPGWHTTLFPPYFVAGAIFSGLAMVMTLMVICRVAFRLESLITPLHFDRMARLILATGSMVAYAYLAEFFMAWYSGNPFEQFAHINRALGPYGWAFAVMLVCNVMAPQVFWLRRARTSIPVLFTVSILVNIGMWLERFVIVVTSLHRDFLPSSWDYFSPTLWDIAILLGSFGLFLTLFCLFVRYLPMVAMAEVKSVLSPAHQATSSRSVTDPRGPARPGPAAGGAFGLLAEFPAPEQLRAASGRLDAAGYTRWEAHSPFFIEGLQKAKQSNSWRLGWLVLAFGLAGATAGLLLQWWTSAVAYPHVVSGKPLFSWPAFIPIAFECGILGGALGAVVGLLLLARLPRPYHALFNSKRFEAASDDRFFISIEAQDPRFSVEETGRFLKEMGATHVELVQA